MRSGAANGHTGYFHGAAFYDSDEAFLQVTVPFLQDGLQANEPVVAAFGPRHLGLLRAVFGADSGVRFLDGDAQYRNPAQTIRRYRELLGEYVKDGAVQIRAAGNVPHPGVGAPWEWWARYEAAINHAYDDFPLWSMCLYDTRTAPPTVVEQVRRAHPVLSTSAGHLPNAEYDARSAFLRGGPAEWRDPAGPAVELVDPEPAQARAAVRHAAAASPMLTRTDLENRILAVSEVVTNAILYSRPPVHLRIWAGPDRVVVAVTDPGDGPDDPFIGLMPINRPDPGGLGGLGLWLAHHGCAQVSLGRGADGFTVRLVAGVAFDR
jgi:anti-sigma regulatory factor (Ser/Thr protein kinase)